MLNAKRNVTFHSNQTVAGQFTAESATQNIDHHADIKQTILLRFKRLFLFCLVLSETTDFWKNFDLKTADVTIPLIVRTLETE